MNNQDLLQVFEKKLESKQKKYSRNLKRTSLQAKKFLDKNLISAKTLRDKSNQILAAAGLTGILLVNPLTATSSSPTAAQEVQHVSTTEYLKQNLQDKIPHKPTKLTYEESEAVSKIIKEATGINATPYLEDQSLNHNIGYIGYEQHLQRFPGDNISLHDDEQIAGIAPGKGAWGYFARSKDEFTTQDYLREKYYSVAQTLYLPDWNTNFKYLRDWYKYRKILIVNPVNGQSVVTVLADAGPAEWTGKQFGASPEAMKELNLHKGPRKGLVLFFFIDDPEDKIPLGPVTQKINI